MLVPRYTKPHMVSPANLIYKVTNCCFTLRASKSSSIFQKVAAQDALLPASNASRHSKVTSNVSGFLKAVGLSRTTTLVTFTMDIFSQALPSRCPSRSNEVFPHAFRVWQRFLNFHATLGRNEGSKLGDIGNCGEDEGSRALLPRVVMHSSV